jgi:hypothetical protein
MHLCGAREKHPEKDKIVARREAERLVFLSLGFLGLTSKNLGIAHLSMSGGQVWIERQCALEFGTAFSRAVGRVFDDAHPEMRPCIVGRQGQHLGQCRFGGRETRGAVVSHIGGGHKSVDPRGAYECIDIARIESQGAFEKRRALA